MHLPTLTATIESIHVGYGVMTISAIMANYHCLKAHSMRSIACNRLLSTFGLCPQTSLPNEARQTIEMLGKMDLRLGAKSCC